MFDTSLDVLYIVLSVCVAVVSIFLSLFLYNATRVLKQAQQITSSIEELTQTLDTYVRMPAKLILAALEKGKEVSQYFARKQEDQE